MSQRLIIIDGYNVILRSPQLKPGEDRTLEQARDKLVNLLSWTVGGDDARLIVIFDGAMKAGPPDKGGRVEVRFSSPPRKADDDIHDLVEDAVERGMRVTVVTADLEVARHARAMGADISLSDLFLASVLGSRQTGQTVSDEASDKPASLSKKEIEEWAEMFRKHSTGEDDPRLN